jgi:hypothetical protein
VTGLQQERDLQVKKGTMRLLMNRKLRKQNEKERKMFFNIVPMKPTKNRIFCKDCGRKKMLFETEKKADNFIRFNVEEIESVSGHGPKRSYFCIFCNGWHITSKQEKLTVSRTEKIIEQYHTDISNKKIIEASKQCKKQKENEAHKAEVKKNIDKQIQGMDDKEKEGFFEELIKKYSEEINILKKLPKTDFLLNEIKRKNKELTFIHLMRKENGFKTRRQKQIQHTNTSKTEQKLEEWEKWHEKIKSNSVENSAKV